MRPNRSASSSKTYKADNIKESNVFQCLHLPKQAFGKMDCIKLIEKDLITLEVIKLWKTDALKEHCRRREYKVTGTRDEQCARAYFRYNKEVPENPSDTELD
jgi:hypothetical protein